jgi:hypothetical protein
VKADLNRTMDTRDLQCFLRSSPRWVAMRRWQREGFLRAFRRHQLWKRVLKTRPVRTAPRSKIATEIHLLCHRLDYLSAIWALKTFYRTSSVDFPLVVHVNGNAERQVYDRLQVHFPDATVIPRADADQEIEPLLAASYPRLLEARRASPFMPKLTDFPLLARGTTVLAIDGDILFFSQPQELLKRATNAGAGYTFQRDPESTYNLSEAEALSELGIRLAPRVNTGLMVYRRELPDLSAFERYLRHPGVARPNGFIEQTVYALHASQVGGVEYFSDKYALSLQAGLSYEGIAARHYAGPSRTLLSTEGIPEVENRKLLTVIS